MAAYDIDEATLEELWDDFHTVVNMTSRELREWLMTESAGEDTEQFLDQAETGTGQHVLRILSKRRQDLTRQDVDTMRRVVDTVMARRREDLEPVAGDMAWRHRLMAMGHDPLKPPGGGQQSRES